MRGNNPKLVSDLQVGDVAITTQHQVDRARAFVASKAADHNDAADLLGALGLMPGQIVEQPHLYEPGVR